MRAAIRVELIGKRQIDEIPLAVQVSSIEIVQVWIVRRSLLHHAP
ncbi:hypothetical protein [Paraburkholderia sp. CNPSo 3281]|nr:hypothetical protein [Paraburkholderia sp. CNPSo 3281]